MSLVFLVFAASPGSAAVRAGVYRCHSMPGLARVQAATPEAFTITSAVDYADLAGRAGKYAYDARTRRLTFHSGPMKDVLVGADVLYDTAADRVTFAPPAGDVVLTCIRQP